MGMQVAWVSENCPQMVLLRGFLSQLQGTVVSATCQWSFKSYVSSDFCYLRRCEKDTPHNKKQTNKQVQFLCLLSTLATHLSCGQSSEQDKEETNQSENIQPDAHWRKNPILPGSCRRAAEALPHANLIDYSHRNVR